MDEPGVEDTAARRRAADRLLRHEVDRLWVRHTTKSDRLEDRSGLDSTDRVILRALDRLGDVRSTVLAEALCLTRPVISRRLTALGEAGIVRAQPDPSDGRATLVQLTPAGNRLLDDIDEHGARLFGAVVADFDVDEVRTLARLLARFNDQADIAVGAERRDPDGTADDTEAP